MNIHTVHAVAFSPCGGTMRVVQALCEGTGAQVVEHNMTTPAMRRTPLAFSDDELVCLAFPVYAGLLPKTADDVFRLLSGNDTPAVLIAVYGNRAWEGALLDMHARAVARGFRPIAAAAAIAEHSMLPEVAAHRPDAADTLVLAEFGRRVYAHAASVPPALTAPGTPREPSPRSASAMVQCEATRCTGCGLCVQVCPTAAIDEATPQQTDPARCITCAACTKYCPEKARTLIPPVMAMVRTFLQQAYERKEPEFFL